VFSFHRRLDAGSHNEQNEDDLRWDDFSTFDDKEADDICSQIPETFVNSSATQDAVFSQTLPNISDIMGSQSINKSDDSLFLKPDSSSIISRKEAPSAKPPMSNNTYTLKDKSRVTTRKTTFSASQADSTLDDSQIDLLKGMIRK
jgi:hypothetical protein